MCEEFIEGHQKTYKINVLFIPSSVLHTPFYLGLDFLLCFGSILVL